CHGNDLVGGAGFGVFCFVGSFASAVFSGDRREFLFGVWAGASDEEISACIAAGSRWLGFCVQYGLVAEAGDCGNFGSAADRAVYRAGGGTDFIASTLGGRALSIQNVALSGTGSADDRGMGLALLANGASAQMGIAADCDWYCGVFDLGVGSKTMAV